MNAHKLCWTVVLLGFATSVLLGAWLVRARGELAALASEVEREEAAFEARYDELPGAADHSVGGTIFVSDKLVAMRGSGVLDSVFPTDVLQLVGSALPQGTTLIRLSSKPISPHPFVLVEAITDREVDIRKLEANVASSTRVIQTKIMEEQRLGDGRWVAKLRIELREGGSR